jgi:hypothetical protein
MQKAMSAAWETGSAAASATRLETAWPAILIAPDSPPFRSRPPFARFAPVTATTNLLRTTEYDLRLDFSIRNDP